MKLDRINALNAYNLVCLELSINNKHVSYIPVDYLLDDNSFSDVLHLDRSAYRKIAEAINAKHAGEISFNYFGYDRLDKTFLSDAKLLQRCATLVRKFKFKFKSNKYIQILYSKVH